MGQFSWITQDTKCQIFNAWDDHSDNQVSHMVDPRDGTDYEEKDYQGYGIFGGRDFYELFADMNKELVIAINKEYTSNFNEKDLETLYAKNYKDLTKKELESKRNDGIDLWGCYIEPDSSVQLGHRPVLKWDKPILTPILVENYKDWEKFKNEHPKKDPNQGWYIPEEEIKEFDG